MPSSTRRWTSGSGLSKLLSELERLTFTARGTDEAVVGELIAGRYEVEELVGSGGMSSVFRARDRLLERRGAVENLPQHLTPPRAYVERVPRGARAPPAGRATPELPPQSKLA